MTQATPTVSSAPLSLGGLEEVYDALAQAIDQAGPERSELFLVKLVLLNARRLGSAELLREHIDQALRDL